MIDLHYLIEVMTNIILDHNSCSFESTFKTTQQNSVYKSTHVKLYTYVYPKINMQ